MATIAEVRKQCRAKDFDWRTVNVPAKEFDPKAMLAWSLRLGLRFSLLGGDLYLDMSHKIRRRGRAGENEELAFFACLNKGAARKSRYSALGDLLRSQDPDHATPARGARRRRQSAPLKKAA